MGRIGKGGLLLRTAGAVLVVVLVLGFAYLMIVVSDSRLTQTVNAPTETIAVPSDAASLQYGQHIAGAIALCTGCHGTNMAGRVIRDDSAARLVAPNLTRGAGGVGSARDDMELARAIREGVSPSGRPLLMMPTDNYRVLSDTDLGALVEYIRSLPAVNNALPTTEIRPQGRLELATGQLALLAASSADASTSRPTPAKPGLTPEYGAYLTTVAGCSSCHGPALSGGKRAPDITASALGNWSDADFLRAMRTGRAPDGRILDPSMPWQYYAQMTELELRAIWSYLQVIAPR